MSAFEELKKFADTCGIPNVGGVKKGWGTMSLKDTPMLKFKSEHYVEVRKALATTLEANPKLTVFFRSISLIDAIKGKPPKGKYFTVCVESRNDRKLGQMCISYPGSIGV